MRHLNAEGLAAFLRHYPHAKVLDVGFAHERNADSPVSHHVPWRMPDWKANPEFLEQVLRSCSLDDFVLVICCNGDHSLEAGMMLERSGFKYIYNLLGGYRVMAGGPVGGLWEGGIGTRLAVLALGAPQA